MAYDSNILRQATQALERKKARRISFQEELRQKIYQEIPRIAVIDRSLRKTVAQIIAVSMKQNQDPTQALAKVRANNQTLQEERTHLLTSHGYTASCLDDTPSCPNCGDAGWVGRDMCHCLKELCTKAQIHTLSNLLNLGEQSFERFQLSWYSPFVLPGEKYSARQNMETVYNLCRSYACQFHTCPFPNLLLHGNPGLGKTFLSACVAREVSQQGISVVYDTAVNILAQFEIKKFSRDEEDSREAKDGTRQYLGCDLLILDDLGSEMTTPFVQSALYQLINTRLTTGKHTIISTNLSPDDIKYRYTPQLASRIVGEYYLLPFYGEDIRLQKKNKTEETQ